MRTESFGATLADSIRILYFLEDLAQEGLLRALLQRVAAEESICSGVLKHDIRSARGGSRVVNEFRKFLRDTADAPPEAHLLVAAIDANCKRRTAKIKELAKCVDDTHPLKEAIVYAVPDPHIERWYLLDQRAFKLAVGLDRAPELPPYKCKRDHYKNALSQALRDGGVSSVLGGAEYAEKIVENVQDLDTLGRQDNSFQAFIQDLRSAFRKQKRERKI